MKILIVEDEDSIREVEKAYLQRAGYTVEEATDGAIALEKFASDKFDLVVLDLNLQEKDGIEVCKEIRKTSKVPVVMVTARVEEIDEIIGLEIGADDYLKKPFSPNILVARVQALLRRFSDGVINIENLHLDPEKMHVSLDGKPVELTTTQFNILHLLAKTPGKVFTREQIIERSNDETIPKDVLDRTIDAHIKSIRKLIEEDTKHPKYIQTVIGRGYKFNDEI